MPCVREVFFVSLNRIDMGKAFSGSAFEEASEGLWRLKNPPKDYYEEVEFHPGGGAATARVVVLGRVFASTFDYAESRLYQKATIMLVQLRMEVRMFYGVSAMELRKAKRSLPNGEWAKFMASWALASEEELVMKVRNDFYKP